MRRAFQGAGGRMTRETAELAAGARSTPLRAVVTHLRRGEERFLAGLVAKATAPLLAVLQKRPLRPSTSGLAASQTTVSRLPRAASPELRVERESEAREPPPLPKISVATKPGCMALR